MANPPYRIFFDTSAYIAALISPKGAAGELLRLVEAGAIRMLVSQEVIIDVATDAGHSFSANIFDNSGWRQKNKLIAPVFN